MQAYEILIEIDGASNIYTIYAENSNKAIIAVMNILKTEFNSINVKLVRKQK